MRTWAAVAALSLVLVGCGGEEPRTAGAPAVAGQRHGQDARAPNSQVRGLVRVVDLQRQPLAGMAPIATLQPNAFDEPVASGPLTAADGRSALLFPADQRVCVRAWDPELRFFANNYVDVLPNTGTITEEMEIIMAPAASFEMTLLLPGGLPAANRNVGLMMFHPTRGPWWPSEGNSDSTGRVEFVSIPPGRFLLKVKIDSGESIDLPELSLPPGASVDLGPVSLQ